MIMLTTMPWWKIIIIIIVSLIVIWGVYAGIITIDLPFDKGIVCDKRFEPYNEYQKEETSDDYDTSYYTDVNGNLQSYDEYNHTDHFLYLIKDYEDYIVTIEKDKAVEKNYIFFKNKYIQRTVYYVTKSNYEKIGLETIYDNKIFKGSLWDYNNEKILLKTWETH
jgi:hypothetical protein